MLLLAPSHRHVSRLTLYYKNLINSKLDLNASKLSINISVVDELSDQLSNILALPLRCHVSHTMNGCESKVVVIDEVSGDLVICGPCGPVLGDAPALLSDPFSGTKGGYSSVCVSRVVHQAIAVLLHCRVDPDGPLSETLVGVVNLIVALLISWKVAWYVESQPDIFAVEVD